MLRAVGVLLLRGLILVVRILPLPAVVWLGGSLGTLVRWLSKKRYNVALANLDYAYGDELSKPEKVRIAKECFRNLGKITLEMIKFAYMSQEEMNRRFSDSGYESAKNALDKGKGAVGVTAHLGPFELAARWAVSHGHEMIVLMREARDAQTTELMKDLRRRNRFEVVSIKDSLKGVMRALRRNAVVGIACDQNANDVVVPFFGKPTGTADGPARISLTTGAPIIFVFTTRRPGGKYHVDAIGPLEYHKTGDMHADIENIMTLVNREVELAIRRAPEQWFWFHNRWKSSPKVQ